MPNGAPRLGAKDSFEQSAPSWTQKNTRGTRPADSYYIRRGPGHKSSRWLSNSSGYLPPSCEERVPAVVMWSPYGKSGSGVLNLHKFPFRAGVPYSKLSGYESFEGLDPATWVPKGYAIVNIDIRGINDSEGDLRFWGTADGRDGYDAVEEIAKLPWCNGRVALAGNSWLAMSQWFIAAERPPHLVCIAPLEAVSDTLRESRCRGGVPASGFSGLIVKMLRGRGEAEDIAAMLEKYSLSNDYWNDKRVDFSKIQVPAYILASYSTTLHTLGSVRGFEEIPHKNTWLTVHATQEWYDLYTESRTDDLQRFFDHYTKGHDNGWMQTPRFRLSVLGFNQPPQINMSFATVPWGSEGSQHHRLYLIPDMRLGAKSDTTGGSVVYRESMELSFAHTFAQPVTIAGPSKLVIYISSTIEDFDVYCQLRKADAAGTLLEHGNMPLQDLGVSTWDEVPRSSVLRYLGPSGILRASRREVSRALSQKHWDALALEKDEPVPPGQIVRLEIWIWPTAIAFEAEEQLVLKVAGHNMGLSDFENTPGNPSWDRGTSTIYMGGEYESYLEYSQL